MIKTTPEILRKTADKARFTYKDTRELYAAFLEVIKEELIAGNKISLDGFIFIYFHKIKERTQCMPGSKKIVTCPEQTLITVKPRPSLRNILKENK